MAKIRYLQSTHDSMPGDEKIVNDQCAKVLVLLHKAEYMTGKKVGRQKKKKVNAETG
nr:hypothetical protein [Entomohabitans teleogrylli]